MKFFASKTQTAAKGKGGKAGSKAKPQPAPARPLLTLDQWLDVAGIGLLLLALISILAILTPTKGVLGNLVDSFTRKFIIQIIQLISFPISKAPACQDCKQSNAISVHSITVDSGTINRFAGRK